MKRHGADVEKLTGRNDDVRQVPDTLHHRSRAMTRRRAILIGGSLGALALGGAGWLRTRAAADMSDPAFMAELMHCLRFNPTAAMTTGDGLYSVASGSPALPDWLGPRLFDMAFTAEAENKKYARQRFSLQATALGLKTAYINQPVEVPGLRADLASLAGLPGRRPDIVMRLGRAPAMAMSAHRPVDNVMV